VTRSIPWVDLQGSVCSPLVMSRVSAVLNSGRLIGGSEIGLLEERVSGWMGRRFGVAVNSGTAALELGLAAVGVESGDEVIVPAVSFVATVGAVLRTGAVPVVVDIGPSGPWMDPDAACAAVTDRTRAMVPVHLFGSAAPAIPTDVTILDDACQAVCDGGPSVGRISAVSFYPTKVLGGLGEGGMLLTDDETLAQRLARMRAHGLDESGKVVEVGGTNARLDAVSAAALNARMDGMKKEVHRRRAIAAAYDAVPGIAPVVRDSASPVAVYAIRHPQRDKLAERLSQAGIPTRVYYPQMVHQHPAYRDRVVVRSSIERASAFCTETLSLPCHGGLTDDEVACVVSALGRCL
jgi:dTDP-4-amino-4,6-dideoxygalactose transaminase